MNVTVDEMNDVQRAGCALLKEVIALKASELNIQISKMPRVVLCNASLCQMAGELVRLGVTAKDILPYYDGGTVIRNALISYIENNKTSNAVSKMTKIPKTIDKGYKIYPRLDDNDYESEVQNSEKALENGKEYIYSPNEVSLQWQPLGNRVDIGEIMELRKRITSLVKAYRITVGTKKTELPKFDRVLGEKLLEWMPISASIAADNGMWAYLTICLIPDVIKWRWGYDIYGESQKINRQHYYGSKNYLKRLWFGAYLLDDKELHSTIDLNMFDSLIDRPISCGYPKYMATCVRHFRNSVKSMLGLQNISVYDLFREYTKVVNKKFAYILWFALTKEQLYEVLTECLNKAVETAKRINPSFQRAHILKTEETSD